MARSNKVINNLVGGEIQPELFGRVDLQTYQKSVARCENFIVLAQGGAKYRQGTVYVKSTRLNKKAVLIPFVFNDQQSFLIEATDQKFRFYTQNAAVLETAQPIVSITNANPGILNAPGHGFSSGDEVYIKSTSTQLDGYFYLVAFVDVDNFSLQDLFGNNIDTTTNTVYTGGGTVSRTYEIASPFLEADLETLSYAQNADTMYFAHQNYAPRKLIRTSNTNWTLSAPTFTNNPFLPADTDHYPGCVAFIDSSRLLFAGSRANPETVWASNAPSVGNTDFEDFTVGVEDTDAFIFTLAPIHGKVDAIQWATSTSKFIILGTFGAIRTLYGATRDIPASPTSITAKSINSFGAMRTPPVSTGLNAFYIQRGGRLVRSVEYDIVTDSYITVNRNQVTEHITSQGYKQIVQQQLVRDMIWGCMTDGKLIGLTYSAKEDISGWHRHYLGGSSLSDSKVIVPYGRILWLGIMSRITTGSVNGDQLWLIAERQINNKTVRTIEFLNDEPIYPNRDDFWTDDLEADDTTYGNVLWEAQKNANHLDMAVGFDGSAAGTTANISLTPSGTNGVITIKSSVIVLDANGQVSTNTATNFFTADMVGRQIWKAYQVDGSGGGRALITAFIDRKTVTAKLLDTETFDNAAYMPPGQWYLTSANISGLRHLEGRKVSVVADGGPHPDATVVNGSIALNYQASKVIVGYKYTGTISTLNVDSGGLLGLAEAKTRSLYKIAIRFLNSLGSLFGSNRYDTERLHFRNATDRTDRPSALFSGIKLFRYTDRFEQTNKQAIVIQDQPLPCTVSSIDLFMDTADDQ